MYLKCDQWPLLWGKIDSEINIIWNACSKSGHSATDKMHWNKIHWPIHIFSFCLLNCSRRHRTLTLYVILRTVQEDGLLRYSLRRLMINKMIYRDCAWSRKESISTCRAMQGDSVVIIVGMSQRECSCGRHIASNWRTLTCSCSVVLMETRHQQSPGSTTMALLSRTTADSTRSYRSRYSDIFAKTYTVHSTQCMHRCMRPIDTDVARSVVYVFVSVCVCVCWVKEKKKGRVFIQRLLYTMYISKRSGMQIHHACL